LGGSKEKHKDSPEEKIKSPEPKKKKDKASTPKTPWLKNRADWKRELGGDHGTNSSEKLKREPENFARKWRRCWGEGTS